jgi:hypothetical protein
MVFSRLCVDKSVAAELPGEQCRRHLRRTPGCCTGGRTVLSRGEDVAEAEAVDRQVAAHPDRAGHSRVQGSRL